MAIPPRRTIIRDKKKSLARMSSCHTGRKLGEKLPPGHICVKLPGNRGHHVLVKGDEQIGDLRKKIAEDMDVKERNWGIYIHGDNRLKIVEDTVQLNQIDRNGLHFYPKAVMR